MRIVSASRRTDIPAFYSQWFMNRVRAGYAMVRNPFNPAHSKRVALLPDEAPAIVFWSRNPRPMLGHLKELDRMGHSYYFLVTLTGYPRVLEPFAPRTKDALEAFDALSDAVGPERVVWRYDPIVISDITGDDYIAASFARLARGLRGHTERAVISFIDYYRKVRRATDAMGTVRFVDISDDHERMGRLAARLAEAAAGNGMKIFSCAEELDLAPYGVGAGSCIDAALIGRITGRGGVPGPDRSQRKRCGCVESADIGAYDTCAHGCVYCYANRSRAAVLKNRERHDPDGEFLIP